MTQNSYVLGQEVVIQLTLTNPITQSPIAADDLLLRIQPPSGPEIDIPSGFANPSTGVYSYSQELTMSGLWSYRWEATGTFFAACEGALYVPVSSFPVD